MLLSLHQDEEAGRLEEVLRQERLAFERRIAAEKEAKLLADAEEQRKREERIREFEKEAEDKGLTRIEIQKKEPRAVRGAGGKKRKKDDFELADVEPSSESDNELTSSVQRPPRKQARLESDGEEFIRKRTEAQKKKRVKRKKLDRGSDSEASDTDTAKLTSSSVGMGGGAGGRKKGAISKAIISESSESDVEDAMDTAKNGDDRAVEEAVEPVAEQTNDTPTAIMDSIAE